MAKEIICEFCGQVIADASKVKHYREAVAKHEQSVRDRVEKALRTAIRAEMRETIMKEAEAKADKKYEKRERDLNQQVDILKEQVEYHKRKAEKLSSVDRGEFNQQDLLFALQREFKEDDIKPQKRGAKGTDIIHVVRYKTGVGYVDAGRIIYECKDRLTWSRESVQQAVREKELHRASHVVIVSPVLPRRQKGIAREGDVFITDARCLPVLAHALRQGLVEMARLGLTGEGQKAKTEQLYAYLSGDDFRRVVNAVTDASSALNTGLIKERDDHEKVWTQREGLHRQITSNIITLRETISGIVEKHGEAAMPAVLVDTQPVTVPVPRAVH